MDNPAARYLVTQDGVAPTRHWNEPFWLRSHVTCFWLGLDSCTALADPGTWTDEAALGSNDFSVLMQAFRNQGATHDT